MKLTGLGREEIRTHGKPVSTERAFANFSRRRSISPTQRWLRAAKFSQRMRERAKAELVDLHQLRAQHKQQLEIEFAHARTASGHPRRKKQQRSARTGHPVHELSALGR